MDEPLSRSVDSLGEKGRELSRPAPSRLCLYYLPSCWSTGIGSKQNVFGSLSAAIVDLANPAYISPLNLTLTYPATYSYTITTSNSITTYSDGTNTWTGIEELTGEKPEEPMSLLMQEILAEEEAQAGRNDYDRIVAHVREKKERVPMHKRNQPEYEKARHAK